MSSETSFNHLSYLRKNSLTESPADEESSSVKPAVSDGEKGLLLLPNLPFSLDLLPASAYLVGGAVRDALLHRQGRYLDLDFVLPENTVETAKKIARQYHQGFVLLDEKRQIARVVFPQGTVDFALQEGDSLEQDLYRRDFTLNAIAYNWHRQELLDPLNGLADLQKGLIKMVSPANLKDDPLRLLRAYRQAAQLNFTIEPETRKTIRSFAGLIERVAPERVQTELNYLFFEPQGSSSLIAAGEDGLLQPWFVELDRAKFEQLEKTNSIAYSLAKKYHTSIFNQPHLLSLTRLATLVSQAPEKAELELLNLRYSRKHLRLVLGVVKYLPQLQSLTTQLTVREQYFFFLATKEFFPILVIRAIATGVELQLINNSIENYLDPNCQIAHPQPLVTGKDLIENLQLKPSPLIGELLTEIQIARAENKIKTDREALQFASYLLKTDRDARS